jgi:hypothetical protein
MSTTSRGYGIGHQRTRAMWEPVVASGAIHCARCGKLIEAGAEWDLDHRDDGAGCTLAPRLQSPSRRGQGEQHAARSHAALSRVVNRHTHPSRRVQGFGFRLRGEAVRMLTETEMPLSQAAMARILAHRIRAGVGGICGCSQKFSRPARVVALEDVRRAQQRSDVAA